MTCFVTVTLFLRVIHHAYAQETCEGSKCCAGYMFDNTTRLCVPCSPGFVGKNCEKACPYPTFGDSCQYHCFCAKEHCSIDRGCITLSGNERWHSTAPMIPSGEKNKGFLGLNRTKVALFEETYPRHTNSTAANNSQNDVGVVSKNRQNAMFFGSLVFNALFVVVIFVIATYCGYTTHRKRYRNKTDNSTTAVQYHEIDEGLVGCSGDYNTLHSNMEETEIREKAYDNIEMGKFLVTCENEHLNRARQSSVITLSPNRASQTMPKEIYPIT